MVIVDTERHAQSLARSGRLVFNPLTSFSGSFTRTAMPVYPHSI
jgi:hypothetical protein